MDRLNALFTGTTRYGFLAASCSVILALTACHGAFVPADHSRLSATRAEAENMRSMLAVYYAGSTVLDDTWYLPTDAPARQKGIEFLADKFARALVWQDSFVIGTIGSSVTAGHDNCRYDSYQEQLQRLLGPVLSAGGVRLYISNAGQGGNCGDSFDNQVWCLPVLAGDDADVTHYSWTYFEAGRQAQALSAHEMFYRYSLMMNHSPVPQLIYASSCKDFSEADQTLLKAYAPFGADVLCMTRGIERQGYVRGENGAIGDTLHDTTRYGESPGVSAERRQSLGVMYRNWHPGPLLFQLTADTLAWRYSAALLLALDWIETEPRPQQRWPRKPVGLIAADLPSPSECPAAWCEGPHLPRCIVFEKPVFGKPGVTVLEAESSGWVFDPGLPLEQSVPKAERGLQQCLHPNRCSGWTVPAGSQAGPLTFELPQLDLGLVAVCCGKKRCGEELLAAGAKFRLDGRAPTAAPEILWEGKCVQVQAQFHDGVQVVGHSHKRSLSLEIRLPARDQPLPPITHVFGL